MVDTICMQFGLKMKAVDCPTLNMNAMENYLLSHSLIVSVPVNQEVVYISVIYGMFSYDSPAVSNFTKKTFMYASSNSERGHISVTSWSLVRQSINQ